MFAFAICLLATLFLVLLIRPEPLLSLFEVVNGLHLLVTLSLHQLALSTDVFHLMLKDVHVYLCGTHVVLKFCLDALVFLNDLL